MDEQLETEHDINHTSDLRTANESAGPGRPASIARTLAFTACALLISAVVTGSVARQDKQRFTGELTAEVSQLIAPADGVVELMNVTSGQIVLPGAELFIIRDTQLEEQLRKAQSTLDGLQIDFAAASARSKLELQQRKAELESATFDTELTLTSLLQQQFQQSFESTALGDYLKLFDALASTGSPPIDLRSITLPRRSDEYNRVRAMIERAEVENSLDALQTRVELCESRLKDLRDSISSLPDQIETAHRIPVIQASIESVSAELEELKSLQAERSVNSPIYGMAGVLRVQEQKSVSQGELLLEVFDRDHEFVTVDLPASLVASLNDAQLVTLNFPDEEERQGRIQSIPPQLTLDTTGSSNEATVSLRIHSTGKPWPTLPIGSSLEVSID
jgi:multidrug efflux pump subunit AcrA (membrane-fusion protein)